MFLAEKPRAATAIRSRPGGMSGGEIGVLGYRGMKEYELGFDGFEVPAGNLLGRAARARASSSSWRPSRARASRPQRAVGVAQNALELGLRYMPGSASSSPSRSMPSRASPASVAWMAVETMIARQLTYFAAREKDSDRRCDIEAGMAKSCWPPGGLEQRRQRAADPRRQRLRHGIPVSRVLCDARILNIFEGAAEIQAQVVCRGLIGAGTRPPSSLLGWRCVRVELAEHVHEGVEALLTDLARPLRLQGAQRAWNVSVRMVASPGEEDEAARRFAHGPAFEVASHLSELAHQMVVASCRPGGRARRGGRRRAAGTTGSVRAQAKSAKPAARTSWSICRRTRLQGEGATGHRHGAVHSLGLSVSC